MLLMHIATSASSSSSALLRASRVRFSTSLSSFPSPASPSRTFLSSPRSHFTYRRLSSSSFRSLRWSHGFNWRSPVTISSQIKDTAPAIERFHRKMATNASENPFKGIFTSLPKPGGGEFGKFYSLPALNDPRIDKLPYSIKILLESAIRNCDNFQVTKADVEKIIDRENTSPKLVEISFKPAHVLLQDFTGVPAVVDLACMRDAMNRLGGDFNKINPLVSNIEERGCQASHGETPTHQNILVSNLSRQCVVGGVDTYESAYQEILLYHYNL